MLIIIVSSQPSIVAFMFNMLLLTGILLLLITTFVCFKLCQAFSNFNGSRSPPGPSWAVPFLGHLLFLGKKPNLAFRRWRARYGPIVSWKMGSKPALLLSDLKLIRELFGKEVASGRDHSPIFDVISGRAGLLTSEGRTSSEQRSFSMRTFRELGLVHGGALETTILEEGQRLVKHLEGRADSDVEVTGLFTGAILNNMWTIISGEKHDWTVSSDLEHIKALNAYFRHINKVTETGLVIAPWLRYVIPGSSGWSGWLKASEDFRAVVETAVNKRLESNDAESSFDFISQYLVHMEGVSDPESSFYKETGKKNLRATASDLIFGGAETTSGALEFAMLYLAHHPGVQVEMQKELDTVLGSRLPSLMDKLPYLEAVVLEVLRLASQAIIGFPHRLMEAVDDFHGYSIPKGTVVFADIYNVNHDPETWTLPEQLNPSRFLNEKGELSRTELVIPFSLGKRRCPGESLAKSILVLFLASIFQKLSVKPVEELENWLDHVVTGISLKPKPFQVVFKPRAC